jgi:hypothetical protein
MLFMFVSSDEYEFVRFALPAAELHTNLDYVTIRLRYMPDSTDLAKILLTTGTGNIDPER